MLNTNKIEDGASKPLIDTRSSTPLLRNADNDTNENKCKIINFSDNTKSTIRASTTFTQVPSFTNSID